MLTDEFRPRRTPHAYAVARLASGEGSEVAELREEVRRLGEELDHARERERRRIAREMHDSTVQDLVAIGLMLRRLRDMIGKPAPTRILNEARGILARTQQDLRTLSFLLHPPVIDSQGLAVALRALIRGLSSRMSVRVDLVCDPSVLRTSADLEHELYRVVQESLINIHKHAHASRAVVRFFREGSRLVLEIEDDGIGLGSDSEQTLGAGVGIEGMRQRVAEFGGTLVVSGGRGGVLVRAEIPAIETAGPCRSGAESLLPILPWKEGLP